MIFARISLNIYLLLIIFLIELNISCLAMNSFGTVDDDDTVNPAIIQQQLNDLQPFGVELKNNGLHVSLKDNNLTDLALTLASSCELVAHYDTHLDYLTTLSRGHLRLLRCFPRLVSLKIHNQTLDASKGAILGEILNQHKSTLITLDLSSIGGFKLTDDGFIAIQQGISILPHIKMLTLKGQNNLGNNGKSTLSNILSNVVSVQKLDLSDMNIGSQSENQVLNPCSKLTYLNKIDVSNNSLGGDFLISLKLLPNLTEINLSKNQITGKKLRLLPKFTSRDRMKTLSIAHNQIDDEGANLISLLPNLTMLDVSSNNITDEGTNELTQLQNLILYAYNNKFSDNDFIFLTQGNQVKKISQQDKYFLNYFKALQNDPSVSSLTLDPSKAVGNIEIGVLARNNTTLKSLYLCSQKIGLTGVKELALNLSSLTSLNLAYCKIGDEGAKELALGNLISLTSLALYDNNIGDEGAKSLTSGNLFALTELVLSANKIESEGAKALAYGNLSALTSLTLGHGNIGVVGAQALANNTTLKKLELVQNSIGVGGAQSLAQNTSLTSLYLEHDNIGALGIQALAQNTVLTYLGLHWCDVNGLGAQALASNTTLRRLDLFHNSIGDGGAQAFAQNTTLRELILAYNYIRDVGAQALSKNTTLTSLALSHNNFTDIGKNALLNSPNPHLKDVRIQ